MALASATQAALWEGLTVLISVLALHGLAWAVALSATPTCPSLDRGVAVLGYGGVVYCAVRYAGIEAVSLVWAYLYLLAVVCLAFVLARTWRSRIGLFSVTLGLLLVLPSLVPHSAAPFVLLIGWGALLSVHSYAMAPRSRSASLADFLFFVLVNPVVVYPMRGARVGAVGLSRAGLFRASRGATALALSGALSASLGPTTAGYALLWQGPLRLVQICLAHCGLAALQIGLMHQLGYRVPECYRQPLLATSPKDFWSRWNTYVGSWVRLYIFQPLARRIQRHTGTWRIAGAIATVASFVCIGFLHDLYATASKHRLSLFVTAWFMANALVLVLWEGVASRLAGKPRGGLGKMTEHALFIGMAAVLAAAFR
jgi:hypothetical protein